MPFFQLFGLLAIMIAISGCSPAQESESPKAKSPRPVSVISLKAMRPQHNQSMTGSVGAWKTEQIGFEIAGRVQQVIEPEKEIEGRILERSGESVLIPGTVLAKLQDDRYQIAVDTAKAAIEVAKRRKESVQVEIDKGVPARLASAKAELQLAQTEFNRTETLLNRKAITESDYDRALASLATSNAGVASVEAQLQARQAELRSSEAEIEQAKQQLVEAQQDLIDTTLYSSFRGQVAQVHVVPGSYVAAGDPVLTIQMMDPIKVELELSAAMSRHYRYGDTVKVVATLEEDKQVELQGFVYMVDPVADSQMRTFTITLLVKNQQTRQAIPEEYQSQNIARTEDIWALNLESIVGGGESLMVEESAIRHDEQGAFLWKITNRHIDEVSSDLSRVLNVTKVRISPGDMRIPFLNNWSFVPVAIQEGEAMDPQRDLVAGALTVAEGDPENWNGQHVLLDESNWLLRPGDIVRVALANGKMPGGIYVPMKAIRHELGKTYIFIANRSDSPETTARRIEVALAETGYSQSRESTLKRIVPVRDVQLDENTRLIVEGVHFLVDGDPIVQVEQTELPR